MNTHSLAAFYAGAFRALQCQVKLVSTRPVRKLGQRLRAVSRIVNHYSASKICAYNFTADEKQSIEIFAPDVVLVSRGEELSIEAVSFLKNVCRRAVINIYTDNPWVLPGKGAPLLFDIFSSYDVVYTYCQSLVPLFYQMGVVDCRVLPFAYCSTTHKYSPGINERTSSVSYLGAWGPLQEKWLSGVSDLDLNIYGNGWSRASSETIKSKCWKHGEGIGPKMSEVIQRSNLIFNMIRSEHAGGTSMKTFEIPACGGVMLTNRTDQQLALFPEDKAALYYSSYDEFQDKLRFYLDGHDKFLEKLRKNALLAVREHTYLSRAKTLLSQIVDLL